MYVTVSETVTRQQQLAVNSAVNYHTELCSCLHTKYRHLQHEWHPDKCNSVTSLQLSTTNNISTAELYKTTLPTQCICISSNALF